MSQRRIIVYAAAIAALGAAITASAPQGPDVSERAVVAAAASYVASYQTLLTSILADEAYVQRIVEQTPFDRDGPRRRETRSEVFFMFAPARHDWMTIRDVMAVDGRELRDRRDIREALRTLPPQDVAAAFRADNARHNIGRTFRNFNEPTLGLLALDDRHRARFSFDRRRVERSGGATLVTLAFAERDRPTLIRDPNGGPVFLEGEAIVEAGGGRVRRVQITGKDEHLRFDLTTVYEPDDRLQIWVPSRFHEEYERGTQPPAGSTSRVEHERILCDAVYSNFRRFDTSVRIK